MEEENDPSSILSQKSDLLQSLISPLSSSVSKLSNKSRTVPSDKDFHFYNNFSEFKVPNKEILSKVESCLNLIGSNINQGALPADLDDSYDWLVNLNDDLIEKFNVSLDEFKRVREMDEGKVDNLKLQEGGFEVVRNKKKKENELGEFNCNKEESLGVKIGMKEKVTGEKAKVPFHIKSIKRPQEEHKFFVNNANTPFEHPWLDRSEDGSRFVHPLEKLSVLDFIDRSTVEVEKTEPLPLEITPFKLVSTVTELKEVAAKLNGVKEFAVDLEHNQYRSFQGLTCLMQISTRTEDFIIDTLKLRVQVGPYLREIFKDPSKRKVMHGADRDVEWLQRDFGIYICNLFDTGQASRVLQLERNSLEYLLHHFCGITANKEYQNADWRLRPLPEEMLKYGREDTHYLLHIYDLMKQQLISKSSDENDLLLEAYKRSYDICTHLYQKELLTDSSFLHIYGLHEADFSAAQLSIVSELYAWRDKLAREEDESTGYILPNRTLLEIAKEMPDTPAKLRRLVKSKHSMVERHLNDVFNLIKRAIRNSSYFETIAAQLMEARIEKMENDVDHTIPEDDVTDITVNTDSVDAAMDVDITHDNTEYLEGKSIDKRKIEEQIQVMSTSELCCSTKVSDSTNNLQPSKKASIDSVKITKKQTSSFGALLGNSSSGKKLESSMKEKEKNASKVEQIKSSVFFPFYPFSGGTKSSESTSPSIEIKQNQPESKENTGEQQEVPVTEKLEEVIQLENSPSDNESKSSEEEGNPSLTDLSESFTQCFQTLSKGKASDKKKQEVTNIVVQPFDYAAARETVKFGKDREKEEEEVDEEKKVKCNSRDSKQKPKNGQEKARGLRRHAFPQSGNRSFSYK